MLADLLLAALGNERLPEKIPIVGVYRAFWELKCEGKYSDLLDAVHFVEGPTVPISEELERALFRFCSSGLGTVDNPDFRYLRIDTDKRAVMTEVVKRHLTDANGLERVRQLSEEFRQKVSATEAGHHANITL